MEMGDKQAKFGPNSGYPANPQLHSEFEKYIYSQFQVLVTAWSSLVPRQQSLMSCAAQSSSIGGWTSF
jgi:hypothetical protein